MSSFVRFVLRRWSLRQFLIELHPAHFFTKTLLHQIFQVWDEPGGRTGKNNHHRGFEEMVGDTNSLSNEICTFSNFTEEAHVTMNRVESALCVGMSGFSRRSSLTELSQFQNILFLPIGSSFSHSLEYGLTVRKSTARRLNRENM